MISSATAHPLKQDIRDIVRISDSRISGTSFGAVIVHVTPESALGGRLAAVQTGGLLELDTPNRALTFVSNPVRSSAAWRRYATGLLQSARSWWYSAFPSRSSSPRSGAAIMKLPLSLIAFVALSPLVATGQTKPNVIVFLADDTGYADIGVQGGTDIPTPNIDSIAKNGVRCTNGYVSCPYCSPTRAGLITGRYQTRFGHEFNEGGAARADFGLPLSEKTIADRLKPLGYATWAIGKWHLGFSDDRRPMKRGFDEFYGTLANTPFFHPQLVDSRRGPNPERVEDDAFYTTDAYGDRAVDLVKSAAGKPFFMYFPFNANHVPSQATEKYLSRFPNIANKERQLYAATMSAMDDQIGRVLQAVRDAGQEQNTLIFFLSDNGGPMTKMGQNGSRNDPFKGQKGDTWEGAIHVPFFVQWKGKIPSGTVYDKPVISLDILPTAVAAAGGSVPTDWKIDGVDLVPHLTGKKTTDPHARLFWRFGPQWAVRQGAWKLVRGYDYAQETPPQVNDIKVTPPMLFNLKDDPGEKKDLAAANPDKVKELQTAWNAWNQEQMPPRWIPVAAAKKKK